jgi:hypothetical protein
MCWWAAAARTLLSQPQCHGEPAAACSIGMPNSSNGPPNSGRCQCRGAVSWCAGPADAAIGAIRIRRGVLFGFRPLPPPSVQHAPSRLRGSDRAHRGTQAVAYIGPAASAAACALACPPSTRVMPRPSGPAHPSSSWGLTTGAWHDPQTVYQGRVCKFLSYIPLSCTGVTRY